MQDRQLDLREATQEDIDRCFDIKKQSFGDYVDQVWGWEDDLQRRLHEKEFDPAKTRIIQLDGRVIGLLVVRTEDGSDWISQIYVLPMFQNKGYGTRVIQTVIREAKEAERSVKLQVLKINPAKKLYERLGFVVTGTNGPHHVMERKTIWSNR